MVLITILNILTVFFTPVTETSPLVEKYKEEISKAVLKIDNIDTPVFKQVPFTNGELYQFKDNSDQLYYLLIAEVASCKLGGCASFEDANDQLNSEFFDVLLILNHDKAIKNIKILDYFSDYGYEVTSKRYLKKFIDKEVCAFHNDNDEIDAISGATISSYALEGMIAQLCMINE